MIEFPTDGGTAAGYLATPPSGSGPGLIVLQEWWGLVDHIKDVTDRFAAAGYVALAPDLYHGDATTSPDEAQRKLMALDIARTGRDLQGAADHLLGLPPVTPKKVGVVGFCMGGQLAVFAATTHDEIAACIDFYGIHPNVDPDFSTLSCPVQAHFGKDDEFVDVESAEALVKKIEQAGGKVEAHFYEAGHAFFNDARPDAYAKEPARQAWDRTLAFLRTHLSG